jgi:hypothetical protein
VFSSFFLRRENITRKIPIAVRINPTINRTGTGDAGSAPGRICVGIGVGVGVADGAGLVVSACDDSGLGVCVTARVSVGVGVKVGRISVTVIGSVDVGVWVGVCVGETVVPATSAVPVGVRVANDLVDVADGVNVGGAGVSVGGGGGCVVGGGGGVFVAGFGVGVLVGTVPCEFGIAHTTGSIENKVKMTNNAASTMRLFFNISLILFYQLQCNKVQLQLFSAS